MTITVTRPVLPDDGGEGGNALPDDSAVTPADPRVAELQALLSNPRLRPYWGDARAELVKLTATSVLGA